MEEQNSVKAHPMLVLATLSLAVAIVVIDGTVLNVSIKNITSDLNIGLKDIQWATTLYSLIIASFTIFGSRLGDIWGRKKAFIIGAIIFAIGSFLTAVSPNFNYFLIGWSVIEGLGAALMIPASSALIISNFEGKERGRAFALYGATAGIASAIGPILGGFLTSNFSWRWAFGINIIVVLGLILGSAFVKNFTLPKDKQVTLDIPGVILSSTGLAALTYGFIESSAYGWFTAKKPWEIFGQFLNLGGLSVTIWAILLGLTLLAIFVWWELKLERTEGKEPLINMHIFLNRQFSGAIGVLALLFSGFTGIITFGVVLYYQSVLNLGAFDSGIGLIALSVAIFITAPISARLSEKISPGRTVQAGLIISLIASILLHESLKIGADRVSLAPSLFVFGIGFGLIASQITNLALSALPNNQAGEAAGINGTIREIGRSFGTAIIGAVFISAFVNTSIDQLKMNTAIPDQAKNSLVANLNNSDQVNSTSSNSCTLSKNICDAIKFSFDMGTISAAKEAIKITGIFIALSFVITAVLPKKVFKVEKAAKTLQHN